MKLLLTLIAGLALSTSAYAGSCGDKGDCGDKGEASGEAAVTTFVI